MSTLDTVLPHVNGHTMALLIFQRHLRRIQTVLTTEPECRIAQANFPKPFVKLLGRRSFDVKVDGAFYVVTVKKAVYHHLANGKIHIVHADDLANAADADMDADTIKPPPIVEASSIDTFSMESEAAAD